MIRIQSPKWHRKKISVLLFSALALVIAYWVWPYLAPHPIAQVDAGTGQYPITLETIATGFNKPTDIQFVPGQQIMLVLEKSGRVISYDLQTKARRTVLTVPVLTRSEQGLLGLAFHPDYPTTACLYVNYVAKQAAQDSTFVSEWCADPQHAFAQQKFEKTRDVLHVAQPYANHNAGQILFGPEGLLYIPLGDGGSGDDPHAHGQNRQTWLGSILRVRITPQNAPTAYTIPASNPFVNDPAVADEIYAYGFRNPWRASFTPAGQLIVSDVGQNLWEEVTLVRAGGNHGWNVKEGFHCFAQHPRCASIDSVEPMHEYSHEVGRSITGGYVSLSDDLPSVFQHYLFADFVTGRFWALNLSTHSVHLLGQWSMLPSTFGRDDQGRMYVAGYLRGDIYRLRGARPSQNPP